jgi:hypothetical protein
LKIFVTKVFLFLHFAGDGCIDEEEFTSVCSSYGLSAAECAEAFSRFSQVCNIILKNKFNLLSVFNSNT